MLSCDSRNIEQIVSILPYALIAFFFYLFVYQLDSILENLSRIILIIIFVGILINLLFGILLIQLNKAKNVAIFGDITCGEITDTLMFLDRIITRNYKSINYYISIGNLENLPRKLRTYDKNTSIQLENIYSKYGLIKAAKKQKRGQIMRWIEMLISAIMIAYILIRATEDENLYNSIDRPMQILITAMVIYTIAVVIFLLLSRAPKEFRSITQEDIDKLEEIVARIIEITSKNITMPLSLLLIRTYPHTKKKGKYTIIEPQTTKTTRTNNTYEPQQY